MVRTLLLGVCSAAALLAQGTTSASTVIRDYVFPPVGIGSTETMRISVTNIAQTPSGSTGATCAGTITFTNASGAVIGTAASFSVGTGQISSVDLPFSKAAAGGTRVEVVGSVQNTITVPSKAPCSLVFSLETYDDTTGVTHVLLGNSSVSAQAAPVTPFGAAH
jgi:hypothetical protein